MKDLDPNLKIAGLISKFLKGGITPQEKLLLQNWILESEHNKELWEKLTDDPGYLQTKMETWGTEYSEMAWQKLLEKTHPKAKVRQLVPRDLLKYAAVLVPLFLIGISFWFYLRQQITTAPVAMKQAKTSVQIIPPAVIPGTQQAKLILSDGQSIDLKATNQQTIQESDGTKFINKNNVLNYQVAEVAANNKVFYNTLVIPRGGEYQLILADGTKVWLNSASTLRFPTRFNGQERQVFITGEAYFEVAKDAGHPFIVSTDKADIKVLGTHFNVNAYPDESHEETTLTEGLVKITLKEQNRPGSDNAGINEALLKPGFQAVISDNEVIDIKKAKLEEALAWKNGMFIFDNETLESILRKLSRWYNVNVIYVNPEIKKYHFTGRINRQGDIANILEFIEATAKVKFSLRNTQLTVQKGE